PLSVGAASRALQALSDEQFATAAPPRVLSLAREREAVAVSVRVLTDPILLAARYVKLSRALSQTPWHVASPRATESVQAVVERAVRAELPFQSATFTAGGREDVDVRMLHHGRPFVLQLRGAHVVPSLVNADALRRVQHALKHSVRLCELRVAPREYAAEMRAFETSKRKHYRCVVYVARALDHNAFNALRMRHVSLLQRTPLRVLHRRSHAVRTRVVYHCCVARVLNDHFVVLDVVTQAGTYVKEFVHGDHGRTRPSVAERLRCFADIVQLDVTHISHAGADAHDHAVGQHAAHVNSNSD
ncbi:unnamed protein product, partial [Agarophyton chilense]